MQSACEGMLVAEDTLARSCSSSCANVGADDALVWLGNVGTGEATYVPPIHSILRAEQ